MKLEPKLTITEHFKDVDDPRVERTKAHQLIDIITIAICAVICGADGWTDIESYGRAKYKWLKKFLELPNGIPSHDTFRRVFARIDPEQFQSCFLNWIKSIEKVTSKEIVAIDGKTLRRSYDTKSCQSAIHMISAWANSSPENMQVIKIFDALSSQSSAKPAITIRTEAVDKLTVKIVISDNGEGMSQDTLAKIFDPFFTTKPVGKGTGLGMAIAYQIIVGEHGGDLTYSSVITLPVIPSNN